MNVILNNENLLKSQQNGIKWHDILLNIYYIKKKHQKENFFLNFYYTFFLLGKNHLLSV